jgi:hypothetical protein
MSHHHHPLRLSVPLPDQNCTGIKLGSLLVEAGQSSGHRRSCFLCNRSIQNLSGGMIDIAEAMRLDPLGDDCKQKMPCQMSGGLSLKYTLPS